MKLELDVEALERLLGGDKGLEAEMQEAFIKAFAEKVVDTAEFDNAVAKARQIVNGAAKQSYDIENLAINHVWPSAGPRLIQLIEQLVKDRAQKVVDDILIKTIEYQKSYWSRELNKAVDKAIEREIEKQVEEGIRKRLDRARLLGEGG